MTIAARIAMAAAILSTLAGCVPFGAQEPQRYYVLDEPAARAAPAKAARATTLLVAPATAPDFYETQDIVYSRTPGVRADYQFHSWTERPGRRVTQLLIARIERDGSFKAVAEAASGIRGDLLLNTRLSEFYHEASVSPGSVRVTLTAELLDQVQRVLLARRTFERSVAAATYDASGAVGAFNQAVGAILDDVSLWVDGAAPR